MSSRTDPRFAHLSPEAHELLAELEHELDGVMDALPILASVIGRDETYRLVNTAYEDWFGVPREEMLGKTLLDVIGPDAYRALHPFIVRGLAGEHFVFEQHGVPYRLGGKRDIRVEFAPHRTAKGEPDGYIAFLRDITQELAVASERDRLLRQEREARAEAQAERDKQESLFLQAPVAIAILEGTSHVFRFANAAYVKLVGGRELLGRTLADAFPDLAGAGFGDLLDHVMRTGQIYHGNEVEIPLAGREALIANFVYAPRRDAAGSIDGVLVTAFDVTEQVVARQRVEALASIVRQRDEQVRRIVEASGVGLWSFDVATGALEVDAFARGLLGIGADETPTVTSLVDELPVQEDRERLVTSMNAAISGRGEGRYVVEFRVATPDGGQRWLESRAQARFRDDGDAIEVAGALIDISARKVVEAERLRVQAVEAQLRRSAEDASRAKDEFLAMLGHELRNPLAPIVTALQLMKMRPDGAFVKERSIIERQVEHLSRLVDDLLDVSRITTGKVELARERIEVAAIVTRSIEIASPLLEQRRHELTVSVPQGLWLDGDPVRLAQVVSNLLTNAAKYTEPGGRITVTAERRGDRIVLAVEDDGVGITAEMLPRVFDVFAQESQSIERARGGLGLGLTIVRSLVEKHGGTVAVKSAGRGKGSTFTVELPVTDGPPAQPPRPELAPAAEPSERRRVLVVDDNVDAAEVLAEALSYFGHDTRVAHDGPAALRLVEEGFAPDVAVLDIGLPVMDGYELARRLRDHPGLTHTRLVALTGYGQPSDHARSAEAGFALHIVKPVRIAQVTALLREPPAG